MMGTAVLAGERDARQPCPGYVVGRIKPLCAGGPDYPKNMQWQTVAEAKVKDSQEREIVPTALARLVTGGMGSSLMSPVSFQIFR